MVSLGITYGNNLEIYLDGNRTYKSGWSIANLTGNEDPVFQATIITCAARLRPIRLSME